jgi:hypothetical protein
VTTAKAIYPVGSAKCRVKCAGRHDCVCDGNMPHEHHICKDTSCVCHSAAAWGLAKAVRRDGSEVYESAPQMLEVQP